MKHLSNKNLPLLFKKYHFHVVNVPRHSRLAFVKTGYTLLGHHSIVFSTSLLEAGPRFCILTLEKKRLLTGKVSGPKKTGESFLMGERQPGGLHSTLLKRSSVDSSPQISVNRDSYQRGMGVHILGSITSKVLSQRHNKGYLRVWDISSLWNCV